MKRWILYILLGLIVFLYGIIRCKMVDLQMDLVCFCRDICSYSKIN